MNQGEIAELKFISTICLNINKRIAIGDNNTIEIKKIQIPSSNGLKNILPISSSYTASDISKLNESDLKKFCENYGISKSGPFSKSDIYINDIGYSLKYSSAAPAALVNHTRRTGWQFVAKHKGVDITLLDGVISDYWSKRLGGEIGEDISNSDTRSPFRKHFKILLPYLEYFIFEGTGSRLSTHPASRVIEFSNPCNPLTWSILSQSQLIEDIWPRLIFSLRSGKGMPADISTLSPTDRESVSMWSRKLSGNLKGALHVRIR
jgi:hypothetical protein